MSERVFERANDQARSSAHWWSAAVSDPRAVVAVAEVTRSGVVESVHDGVVVALRGIDSIAWRAGDPILPQYPRSALKPLQAQAMLNAGLVVDQRQLAVACASHSGEAEHLAVVRGLLASVGLDESALDDTADWPLGADRGAGAGPRRRGARAHLRELQRQARRDARHLRRQQLAARRLPRRRSPAAALDRRPHHRRHRTRRSRRHRRLRSTDGLRVVARRCPGVPGAGDRRPSCGPGDAHTPRAGRWSRARRDRADAGRARPGGEGGG